MPENEDEKPNKWTIPDEDLKWWERQLRRYLDRHPGVQDHVNRMADGGVPGWVVTLVIMVGVAVLYGAVYVAAMLLRMVLQVFGLDVPL